MAKYTAELAALGESTGSLTAEREHITTELSESSERLADERTSACTGEGGGRKPAAAGQAARELRH